MAVVERETGRTSHAFYGSSSGALRAAAFAEVHRFLRPEGSCRFWEHIRNDDSRFWGTMQDVITPVWRWVGAGCHPNRRTQQAIEDAGFTIELIEKFRAAPGTPEIYGVARPV